MAKQKRQPTTLSTLQKAFAAAANFPSMNPTEYKKYFDTFKQNTKHVVTKLGLKTSLTDPIPPTETARNFINYLFEGDDKMHFIAAMRDTLLLLWHANKVVYKIMPGTLEYIDKLMKTQALHVSMQQVMSLICSQGIYIDIPDNCNLKGAFCGLTSINMGNPKNPLRPNELSFLATILTKFGGAIYVHVGLDGAAAETVLEECDPGPATLLSVIAYIACVMTRHDAKGRAYITKEKNGCTYHEIYPIPFEEFVQSYLEENAWMKTGLFSFFGYMSRKTMLADMKQNLAERAELEHHKFRMTAQHENDSGAILYWAKKMVVEWEEQRTIFQYSQKTADTFVERYMETVYLEGFPVRLLDYIPYKTLLLFQTDSKQIALVSICNMDSKNGKGILIAVFDDGEVSIGVFPDSTSPARIRKLGSEQFLLAPLCAFYHTLSVLERKVIMRFEKELLTRGDPSTTALVPVPPRPQSPDKDREPQFAQPEDIRVGAPIEDLPIDFFDLTTRTVKRVSDTEMTSRNGWTMVPHTRRRHPHRYWVGSGTNKRLEVRWLDEMKIHADQKTPTTTVIRDLL